MEAIIFLVADCSGEELQKAIATSARGIARIQVILPESQRVHEWIVSNSFVRVVFLRDKAAYTVFLSIINTFGLLFYETYQGIYAVVVGPASMHENNTLIENMKYLVAKSCPGLYRCIDDEDAFKYQPTQFF